MVCVSLCVVFFTFLLLAVLGVPFRPFSCKMLVFATGGKEAKESMHCFRGNPRCCLGSPWGFNKDLRPYLGVGFLHRFPPSSFFGPDKAARHREGLLKVLRGHPEILAYRCLPKWVIHSASTQKRAISDSNTATTHLRSSFSDVLTTNSLGCTAQNHLCRALGTVLDVLDSSCFDGPIGKTLQIKLARADLREDPCIRPGL